MTSQQPCFQTSKIIYDELGYRTEKERSTPNVPIIKINVKFLLPLLRFGALWFLNFGWRVTLLLLLY